MVSEAKYTQWSLTRFGNIIKRVAADKGTTVEIGRQHENAIVDPVLDGQRLHLGFFGSVLEVVWKVTIQVHSLRVIPEKWTLTMCRGVKRVAGERKATSDGRECREGRGIGGQHTSGPPTQGGTRPLGGLP